MNRSDFIDFAAEVIGKKNEKSALSAEIKAAKDIFAEKHGMDKKSINDSLKEYETFLKDQSKFTVVDREKAQIIEMVCFPTVTAADDAIDTEE